MVLAGGAFEFGVETFPPEKVQDVQVFASPEKRHGNTGTEWWKWVTTQPGQIRRLTIAVPDSSGSEDSPTDVDSPKDWDRENSNSTRNIDSSWGEWFSPCKKECLYYSTKTLIALPHLGLFSTGFYVFIAMMCFVVALIMVGPYLIIVIFFTLTQFLENKIDTKKTRKLRQNTQKIAKFLRYYGKIHSKLPIFRVKSVKIYTGQKNLH